MAIGDIGFYNGDGCGTLGSADYQVASGTTQSILAGTPVATTPGSHLVAAAATNTPVVGTDFYVGIAASTSTETASLPGKVKVTKLVPGIIYMAKPKVAIADQATYDALVGSRVLLDLTGGNWTILAADGSTHGCVIENLDTVAYPGQVAFSIRNATSRCRVCSGRRLWWGSGL